MPGFTLTTHVAVSPDQAFAFLTVPDNLVQTMESLEQMALVADEELMDASSGSDTQSAADSMEESTANATGNPAARPMQMGDHFRIVRRVGNHHLKTDCRVTRFDAPSHFSLTATMWDVSVSYHYLVHADQDGTRIALFCDVETPVLMRLVGRWVVHQLKQVDGGHLERVRQVLASGASREGQGTTSQSTDGASNNRVAATLE